jgi:hypothetical protein
MLVKLIAILFILIGIAGLLLPVVPGILMIAIGILLLYRDRHEETSRLVNAKAPLALIHFYNNFLHNILLPPHYVGVDWPWVKEQVIKSEKINPDNKDEGTDNIRNSLDECMRKARSLALSKYIYTEKKIIRLDPDFIELEGGTKFNTSRIPSYIKGADRLVLLVVTIGDEIENEASFLTSGKDPLKGYLLDRIGSFAVESLADRLEKRLRKDYTLKKNSVSSRFSPGYCDWAIEEQFQMAKVIDFFSAGVMLTEGCMMIPKKSISAIVAVADEGVFKEFVSSCDVCDLKDCTYRRDY